MGEDSKDDALRCADVRQVWFHELTDAAPITFEPPRTAPQVRPIRASA